MMLDKILKRQLSFTKKTITQAPPVVTITFPAVDNVEFNSPDFSIESATVLNVTAASNIQVLVNGNNTTAFDFNTGNKNIDLAFSVE
jgi:1,6-anhydro-N-acetylmuramate kinase